MPNPFVRPQLFVPGTHLPAFLAALLALLLTLLSVPVRAESLATVRTAAWPALPPGSGLRALALVDEQAVAFGEQTVWVLDKDAKTWAASNWRPAEPVLAAVSNARHAFLLTGKGAAVQQVLRLTLSAGSPATNALPALPMPLTSARGAVTDDSLYLAGLDAAGQPRLLQLTLGTDAPAWTVRRSACSPRV